MSEGAGAHSGAAMSTPEHLPSPVKPAEAEPPPPPDPPAQEDEPPVLQISTVPRPQGNDLLIETIVAAVARGVRQSLTEALTGDALRQLSQQRPSYSPSQQYSTEAQPHTAAVTAVPETPKGQSNEAFGISVMIPPDPVQPRRETEKINDALKPLTDAVAEFSGQAKLLGEVMRRASAAPSAFMNRDEDGATREGGSKRESGRWKLACDTLGLGSPILTPGVSPGVSPRHGPSPMITALDRVLDNLGDPGAHHLWGELHEKEKIPHSKQKWKIWYTKLDNISADSRLWRRLIHAKPATGSDAGCVNDQFVWGEAAIDAGAVDKENQRDADCEMIVSEIDLDGLFDLTPQRVEQIFNQAERKGMRKPGSGTLPLGQFGQALRQQGFTLDSDLKSVFKAVDINNDEKICLPAFEVALRSLKLASLFEFHPAPFGELHVIDYSQDRDKPEVSAPVDDIDGLFFGHRGKGFGMRWIHLCHPDRMLLLMLTVKYHLHPLGVQDAFEIWDDLQFRKTKVDKYGNHYVVLLCVFYLDPEWEAKFNADTKPIPPRVEVKHRQECIFLSGLPSFDTMISLEAQGRDEEEKVLERQSSTLSRSSSIYRRYSTRSGAATEWGGSELTGVWQELKETLMKPRTRARDSRCDFLLHEVISYAVDELRPIVLGYRKRLERFQHRLALLESSFEQQCLNDISNMCLDLNSFQRQAVRPLRQAIKRLLDDQLCIETVTYLMESQERLEYVSDDIQQLMDMCKAIPEDFKAHSDKKLNNTLFALTLATVLFMPAQLLAGVYGMNFVDEEGRPTIPELTWRYGYAYFWCTTIGLVSILLFLFYVQLKDKKLQEEPSPLPVEQARNMSTHQDAESENNGAENVQEYPTKEKSFEVRVGTANSSDSPTLPPPQQPQPVPRHSVEAVQQVVTPPQKSATTPHRRSRRRSTISFAVRPPIPGTVPGQAGEKEQGS
eukprot:Hpha_TRINITY_DN16360_c3_g3::TRINITY_DN16360_c3_g3_i1::g.58314::m.58314